MCVCVCVCVCVCGWVGGWVCACVCDDHPPQAAEVCGSLEIDSAIDTVRALAQEMAEAKREAHQGKLLPLPGETVENCALELGATSKTVGSSMAQLLTAANQGNENYTGIASRDTANALRVLAHAVRGVAAGTKNTQTQEYILSTAQQVQCLRGVAGTYMYL